MVHGNKSLGGADFSLHTTETYDVSFAVGVSACENWEDVTNALVWMAGGGVCAAAGVYAYGAAAHASQVFGRTIRETGISDAVALTFDDGPNPAITPALLDLLEQYGAKATFFVIGSRVRAFPDLASEAVKRGHTMGNHTETHPRLTLCSPQRTREELGRCDEAIGEATGVSVRWMRPPYGYRSPWLDGIARERGEEIVMWNVVARDWATQDTQNIIQRLRGTRGGDIVLLHDGNHRVFKGERRHVLRALEYWLPRWKDSGIRFLSMDQVQASSEANAIP